MAPTQPIRDLKQERITVALPDVKDVSREKLKEEREPFAKLNTIVVAMLYTQFYDELEQARGDADNMDITAVEVRPASVEVEVHKQWYQS